MNGAAMNCRPEAVLRSQRPDSAGLHSPGYHLQFNHPHQQNSHPQHSKAMNYQSYSNNFSVDGSSEELQPRDSKIVDTRRVEVRDPRSQMFSARTKEPLELPVPPFEIDENYVGDPRNIMVALVEKSKDLDLDTRIDFLIKSKALAGMHPIFSELNNSEESSSDSDSFMSVPKMKPKPNKAPRPLLPDEVKVPCLPESFDDPEMPLSRPPSPFLSRATYLFWFNKAIELKQQAKAQEQALLEKAAKRLLQDNSSPIKTNPTVNTKRKAKPLLKNLLDEISRELKEVIKQEFIREVLEDTAFNTLEDWWDKQRQSEEKGMLVNNFISNAIPEDREQLSNIPNVERVSDSENVKFKCQGSTSPTEPYPWGSESKEAQEKFQNTRCVSKITRKKKLKNAISVKNSRSGKLDTTNHEDSVTKNDLLVPVEEKGISDSISTQESSNSQVIHVSKFNETSHSEENLSVISTIKESSNSQVVDASKLNETSHSKENSSKCESFVQFSVNSAIKESSDSQVVGVSKLNETSHSEENPSDHGSCVKFSDITNKETSDSDSHVVDASKLNETSHSEENPLEHGSSVLFSDNCVIKESSDSQVVDVYKLKGTSHSKENSSKSECSVLVSESLNEEDIPDNRHAIKPSENCDSQEQTDKTESVNDNPSKLVDDLAVPISLNDDMIEENTEEDFGQTVKSVLDEILGNVERHNAQECGIATPASKKLYSFMGESVTYEELTREVEEKKLNSYKNLSEDNENSCKSLLCKESVSLPPEVMPNLEPEEKDCTEESNLTVCIPKDKEESLDNLKVAVCSRSVNSD